MAVRLSRRESGERQCRQLGGDMGARVSRSVQGDDGKAGPCELTCRAQPLVVTPLIGMRPPGQEGRLAGGGWQGG